MKPRMNTTHGREFAERTAHGLATRSRWGEATDKPARERACPTISGFAAAHRAARRWDAVPSREFVPFRG